MTIDYQNSAADLACDLRLIYAEMRRHAVQPEPCIAASLKRLACAARILTTISNEAGGDAVAKAAIAVELAIFELADRKEDALHRAGLRVLSAAQHVVAVAAGAEPASQIMVRAAEKSMLLAAAVLQSEERETTRGHLADVEDYGAALEKVGDAVIAARGNALQCHARSAATKACDHSIALDAVADAVARAGLEVDDLLDLVAERARLAAVLPLVQV